MKNGEVVAERLAAGSGRYDDGIFAGQRVLEGGGLMNVQLFDTARRQCGTKRRVERLGERGELRWFGGPAAHGANGRALLPHGLFESQNQFACRGRLAHADGPLGQGRGSEIKSQIHVLRLLFYISRVPTPKQDRSRMFRTAPFNRFRTSNKWCRAPVDVRGSRTILLR